MSLRFVFYFDEKIPLLSEDGKMARTNFSFEKRKKQLEKQKKKEEKRQKKLDKKKAQSEENGQDQVQEDLNPSPAEGDEPETL